MTKSSLLSSLLRRLVWSLVKAGIAGLLIYGGTLWVVGEGKPSSGLMVAGGFLGFAYDDADDLASPRTSVAALRVRYGVLLGLAASLVGVGAFFEFGTPGAIFPLAFAFAWCVASAIGKFGERPSPNDPRSAARAPGDDEGGDKK
jgi:hypothetical protein